jgi:hypothetical protein
MAGSGATLAPQPVKIPTLVAPQVKVKQEPGTEAAKQAEQQDEVPPPEAGPVAGDDVRSAADQQRPKARVVRKTRPQVQQQAPGLGPPPPALELVAAQVVIKQEQGTGKQAAGGRSRAAAGGLLCCWSGMCKWWYTELHWALLQRGYQGCMWPRHDA